MASSQQLQLLRSPVHCAESVLSVPERLKPSASQNAFFPQKFCSKLFFSKHVYWVQYINSHQNLSVSKMLSYVMGKI